MTVAKADVPNDMTDERVVPGEGPRRRLGGRSARVRSAVLSAALSVLTEKGIDDFTVAEVAARAGVHETSIYRRWKTFTALALEACLQFAGQALPTPDTGHLRSDLMALLDGIVAVLSSPQGKALLALSAIRHPDAIATRRALFRRRFEAAGVIFSRAVARGEFPSDADPRRLLETLVAPLYLRILLTGESLEDWPRNDMIDRLLAAYAPERRSGDRG